MALVLRWGLKVILKVPQLGRVIIEDDVEIGANSTIDRGAGPDTIIGEGSKIDNLVQIGHNVQLGRGCVIVSHVGISGSTVIGELSVLGGQVGVAGHLQIGAGAQFADVPQHPPVHLEHSTRQLLLNLIFPHEIHDHATTSKLHIMANLNKIINF